MQTKEQYTASAKFMAALIIFSFMGQVAWVVENMYFNVFIYKMFNASARDISLMVTASAVTAAVTTLLIGCLADCVQKRKLFISVGYILWGASILVFCLLRADVLARFVSGHEGAAKAAAVASLGVSLVIVMDCVMTFFGSSANDASFNAWLTDCGTLKNRGKIEGINAMMPLVAILAVFGGFMAFDLDKSGSWVLIYLIIGALVIAIGVLGFFLIEDHIADGAGSSATAGDSTNASSSALGAGATSAAGGTLARRWARSVVYSFRPSVVRENYELYVVALAFAVVGVSFQIFMPYLILYYEKSLGMANYVLILAPAIIIAAVATVFHGRFFDRHGFTKAVVPALAALFVGYGMLCVFRATALVFIGSLCMMTGNLCTSAVFGAKIREKIPEDKTGLFQGIRIIAQVFVPGIIGPAVGAAVLRNAELIVNNDGTTSFLPNANIFFAALCAVVLAVPFVAAIAKNDAKRAGGAGTALAGAATSAPSVANTTKEAPHAQ